MSKLVILAFINQSFGTETPFGTAWQRQVNIDFWNFQRDPYGKWRDPVPDGQDTQGKVLSLAPFWMVFEIS